jgi:hypothetical protein
LRNAQGMGRYRRSVQIPAEWADKSIVLILEGVFHESVILVDDMASPFTATAGPRSRLI